MCMYIYICIYITDLNYKINRICVRSLRFKKKGQKNMTNVQSNRNLRNIV